MYELTQKYTLHVYYSYIYLEFQFHQILPQYSLTYFSDTITETSYTIKII